jgi:hypothetical protein
MCGNKPGSARLPALISSTKVLSRARQKVLRIRLPECSRRGAFSVRLGIGANSHYVGGNRPFWYESETLRADLNTCAIMTYLVTQQSFRDLPAALLAYPTSVIFVCTGPDFPYYAIGFRELAGKGGIIS